jgi:hypothetical protein
MPECRTVQHPVSPVPKWKRPVRYRTKLMQHFFIPVPDWNHGCRNTDAGVSFLDADALLCLLHIVYIFITLPVTYANVIYLLNLLFKSTTIQCNVQSWQQKNRFYPRCKSIGNIACKLGGGGVNISVHLNFIVRKHVIPGKSGKMMNDLLN